MSETKQQDPWDRQKNETNKAYSAFCVYRNMGERRSLSKAVKEIFPNISPDKYTTKIRGLGVWSSKYMWVKRVEAWDAYQETQFRKEMEVARREMAERQVAYGRAMQAKGMNKIKDMLPDELNPDQANRMVDTGVKIERVAMGETDKVEMTHAGEIKQNVTVGLEATLQEYEDVIKKLGDLEDST